MSLAGFVESLIIDGYDISRIQGIQKSCFSAGGYFAMETKITKVGKGGTVTIPASIRRRIGIEDGAQVIAEETEEGVLIRPAVTMPVELYTPERKAEFLLSNAVDLPSYEAAKKMVRQMGLDPDLIPHVNVTES